MSASFGARTRRIRTGSESASRNTTCSRQVPPCSTSTAEMTTDESCARAARAWQAGDRSADPDRAAAECRTRPRAVRAPRAGTHSPAEGSVHCHDRARARERATPPSRSGPQARRPADRQARRASSRQAAREPRADPPARPSLATEPPEAVRDRREPFHCPWRWIGRQRSPAVSDRARDAAATAANRDGATPNRAGTRSARRTAPSTPSIPPCNRSNPRASKHTSPGRSGSTAAPTDSNRTSSISQPSATPAGSGGTRVRRGHRASASPSRMPGWIPNASAASETSPTCCVPPGSGASAVGAWSSSPRSPTAVVSAKRGRGHRRSWGTYVLMMSGRTGNRDYVLSVIPACK